MLTFSLILDGVSVQAISTSENPENVLAFPGAEGGGKYTSGGRGQDVYEVTTIEDYGEGEEPIKGSLRDAVSQDNRTIVFRVSGTIHLKQPLRIKRKKHYHCRSNCTRSRDYSCGIWNRYWWLEKYHRPIYEI